MIGSFGEIVFEVYADHVFTPTGFSRSRGAAWAAHNLIGVKPRREYLNPELTTLAFDIQLSSTLGVKPREMLELLGSMAENGATGILVIGGKAVCDNPVSLISVSESWGEMYSGGELANASVSLEFCEYA